jgi:hypothetical protein
MRRQTFLTVGLAAIVGCAASPAPAAPATAAVSAVEAMLVEGKIADAQRQLEGQLKSDPKDDNARFALGIVQTLRGGERLMQSLYRYGLDPRWKTMVPIVRLPVPENPAPEPLTNAAFRQIVADLLADLGRAEGTLAAVKSNDVKLPLHLGMYRLDFNDDGQAADDETLWQIFSRVTGRAVDEQIAAQFFVAFDKGDVHWLRGYCHLLSAMCESFLAYDTNKLHDYTAQLFFPTAKTRVPLLEKKNEDWWRDPLLDAIAFIHLLDLPVAEPERLKAAHAHMMAVIEQSRLSWAAIRAETDDDMEWVPSPKQSHTAIPGATISEDMVTEWFAFLDELEAVLKGDKLIPFWRGEKVVGLNVKRVFYEPSPFDLVLWIQGGAAIPYLETGPMTEPDFWWDLDRKFHDQFFWFALWVN